MKFITSAVTVERDVDADNFDSTISNMVESIKNL